MSTQYDEQKNPYGAPNTGAASFVKTDYKSANLGISIIYYTVAVLLIGMLILAILFYQSQSGGSGLNRGLDPAIALGAGLFMLACGIATFIGQFICTKAQRKTKDQNLGQQYN